MTSRFVVAGEALVDVVVPARGSVRRSPGGSPLNVAVGLARLGVDTVLLTELGDDDAGRLVLEHVQASGVELGEGTVLPGSATSTATARLDSHGAASYDFDLRWTLAAQTLPVGATALHVGSLGTVLRPGRDSVLDLVQQANDAGVLVTFDPNARPTITPDAEQAWRDVRTVAEVAAVVKLSDEDLEFLQPGVGIPEAAASLLGGRTRLVVVTSGGGGAYGVGDRGAVEVLSRPVDVADTVGAGDSFMAALLTIAVEHGLDGLHEDRLRAYLQAAHEAASITVSRPGADPPRRAELAPGWPTVP